MIATRHKAIFALLVLLAMLAAWRVVGQMQAERHAATDPERALHWRPNDPRALQVLAERRLQAGDGAGAAKLARQLLAHEPLQGQAYRVLAQVAEREGDPRQALKLHLIAARLAPRDLATQAWLTQHFLQKGDYRQALSHVDRVLRMSPAAGKRVYPVFAQLARDDAFAEALAIMLAEHPPWRPGLLAALQDPRAGDPVAAGRILQALKARGDLTPEDEARWLDSLMKQGRWGEAFARWADGVPKPGGRLPLLYNGGFESTPTSTGFDWRVRKVPGVVARVETLAGASGSAAYLRFLNRRVGESGLEHPLYLSPGDYRLDARLRAQALRSELGLQWRISCASGGRELGRGEAIEGSFGWQGRSVAFTVPTRGCEGQWLRLVNPVSAGAGQRVSGELWIDDVAVSVRRP